MPWSLQHMLLLMPLLKQWHHQWPHHIAACGRAAVAEGDDSRSNAALLSLLLIRRCSPDSRRRLSSTALTWSAKSSFCQLIVALLLCHSVHHCCSCFVPSPQQMCPCLRWWEDTLVLMLMFCGRFDGEVTIIQTCF